jgi:hypothetical protein
MVIASAMVAAAVAVFAWGAYLGAVVDSEGTANEGGALVCILLAFVLGAGGARLWRASHAHGWPKRDSELDAAMVAAVVWYGLIAIVVGWILLRVIGVIGPVFTDHGI